MTPSGKERKFMTDGQIDKAVDVYRAMLRKHQKEFESEAVQCVIMSNDYVNEQLGVLRKRVEMISGIIVRRVKVDRTRTPQAALKATGRNFYGNDSVVETMPRGEGNEVDVHIFKPEVWEYTRPGYMSGEDLDKAYARRNLVPADSYSTAAVNEADPAFADERPNATHWKDANGKWCYTAFDRWDDERDVAVRRDGLGWDDFWSFAGLPQVSSLESGTET